MMELLSAAAQREGAHKLAGGHCSVQTDTPCTMSDPALACADVAGCLADMPMPVPHLPQPGRPRTVQLLGLHVWCRACCRWHLRGSSPDPNCRRSDSPCTPLPAVQQQMAVGCRAAAGRPGPGHAGSSNQTSSLYLVNLKREASSQGQIGEALCGSAVLWLKAAGHLPRKAVVQEVRVLRWQQSPALQQQHQDLGAKGSVQACRLRAMPAPDTDVAGTVTHTCELGTPEQERTNRIMPAMMW